jgi:hypothetical protein
MTRTKNNGRPSTSPGAERPQRSPSARSRSMATPICVARRKKFERWSLPHRPTCCFESAASRTAQVGRERRTTKTFAATSRHEQTLSGRRAARRRGSGCSGNRREGIDLAGYVSHATGVGRGVASANVTTIFQNRIMRPNRRDEAERSCMEDCSAARLPTPASTGPHTQAICSGADNVAAMGRALLAGRRSCARSGAKRIRFVS